MSTCAHHPPIPDPLSHHDQRTETLDVHPSGHSCQAEIPLLNATAPPRQPPPPAQASLVLPSASLLGPRVPAPHAARSRASPALVDGPPPDLRLCKLPFYYILSWAECVPQIRMLES